MSDHGNATHTLIAVTLLAGLLLFVWSIRAANTVPVEYRSASPGFGWSWDFDYASAVDDAGRFGAAPRPWAAVASGDRLLLPLDQPLRASGLKITYRGMPAIDRLRLDVAILRLDPDVTYHRDVDLREARQGMTIGDQRFVLIAVTPGYLRLRAVGR